MSSTTLRDFSWSDDDEKQLEVLRAIASGFAAANTLDDALPSPRVYPLALEKPHLRRAAPS